MADPDRKKAALLVGNDDYDDERLLRLRGPIKDIYRLQEVLKQPEIGGFDEVRVLFNASRVDIERAISAVFNNKRPDDLVLLYFAGHGVRDLDGDLFLAAKDTRFDLLLGTAVPASFIKKVMGQSRSRRQILILDCCYAGAFDKSSGDPREAIGAPVLTESTFEVHGYGREVLTASAATQLAWENSNLVGAAESGIFTHFLVEGLETGKAAPTDSRTISVEQLYNYAHDKVVATTSNMTPQRWVDRAQGSFIIARNPRHGHTQEKSAPAFELPKDLLRLLDSPDPTAREGGARILGAWLRQQDQVKAYAAKAKLQQMRISDEYVRVRDAIDEALNLAGVVAELEAERSRAADLRNQLDAAADCDQKWKDQTRAQERQLSELVTSFEGERTKAARLEKHLQEAATREQEHTKRVTQLEHQLGAAVEHDQKWKDQAKEQERRLSEVVANVETERTKAAHLEKHLQEATKRDQERSERVTELERQLKYTPKPARAVLGKPQFYAIALLLVIGATGGTFVGYRISPTADTKALEDAYKAIETDKEKITALLGDIAALQSRRDDLTKQLTASQEETKKISQIAQQERESSDEAQRQVSELEALVVGLRKENENLADALKASQGSNVSATVDESKYTVVVHYVDQFPVDNVFSDNLAKFLGNIGFVIPESRKVTQKTRSIRYFYEKDYQAAVRVQEAFSDFITAQCLFVAAQCLTGIELEVKDFTNFPDTKPRPGVIELWVYF